MILDQKIALYHVHRIGNMDTLWQPGSILNIDDNYQNIFYTKILREEEAIIKRYGSNYDIDYIIAIIEEILENYDMEKRKRESFNSLLINGYILRREKALEEGRKIFAKDEPSRKNALFLTDKESIAYWKKTVGQNNFKVFSLEAKGSFFFSSDNFFPNSKLPYDIQVEKSQNYWKPKVKSLVPHREILFKGQARIIK